MKKTICNGCNGTGIESKLTLPNNRIIGYPCKKCNGTGFLLNNNSTDEEFKEKRWIDDIDIVYLSPKNPNIYKSDRLPGMIGYQDFYNGIFTKRTVKVAHPDVKKDICPAEFEEQCGFQEKTNCSSVLCSYRSNTLSLETCPFEEFQRTKLIRSCCWEAYETTQNMDIKLTQEEFNLLVQLISRWDNIKKCIGKESYVLFSILNKWNIARLGQLKDLKTTDSSTYEELCALLCIPAEREDKPKSDLPKSGYKVPPSEAYPDWSKERKPKSAYNKDDDPIYITRDGRCFDILDTLL